VGSFAEKEGSVTNYQEWGTIELSIKKEHAREEEVKGLKEGEEKKFRREVGKWKNPS